MSSIRGHLGDFTLQRSTESISPISRLPGHMNRGRPSEQFISGLSTNANRRLVVFLRDLRRLFVGERWRHPDGLVPQPNGVASNRHRPSHLRQHRFATAVEPYLSALRMLQRAAPCSHCGFWHLHWLYSPEAKRLPLYNRLPLLHTAGSCLRYFWRSRRHDWLAGVARCQRGRWSPLDPTAWRSSHRSPKPTLSHRGAGSVPSQGRRATLLDRSPVWSADFLDNLRAR